ncbi:MAG: phosphatidylglycerophosphatase A family protein [bacterium]
MAKQKSHNGNALLEKIFYIYTTWFCLGKIPFAPGTFGSLGAIPLFLLFQNHWITYNIVLFLLIIFSIPSSNYIERKLNKKDPSSIVIDEVIGQLIALLFITSRSFFTVFLSFSLFRLFDIIKPPPARLVQYLYGGYGIIMDDIVAGVYTNLVLRIYLFIGGVKI